MATAATPAKPKAPAKATTPTAPAKPERERPTGIVVGAPDRLRAQVLLKALQTPPTSRQGLTIVEMEKLLGLTPGRTPRARKALEELLAAKGWTLGGKRGEDGVYHYFANSPPIRGKE